MFLSKGCNRREKGAITVFLALIFMSLLIFAGAVIDIVRIMAADRKVQSALNSSARSVLAGYDGKLAGDYGIYGVNVASDAAGDDLYRYISVNLEERHEGISFLDIEVDRGDVEVKGMNSLLGDEAFKKQVREYMKYRMPVIVSENLLEQLSNIKLGKKLDFAEGEKLTRDKARELRYKVNEVNSILAVIRKRLAELSADKLEELKGKLSEALIAEDMIYGKNGEGLLEEYNDSREDTNAKAYEGECIGNQSGEFDSIRGESESLVPELQRCLAEVDRTIAAVKPLQEELEPLKDELYELREELSALKDELSDISEDKNSSSERKKRIKEKIKEVREDINDLVERIEELEAKIEAEISGLRQRLSGISLEGYDLREEAVQLADRKAEEIKKMVDQMRKEIENSLLRSIKEDWLIGPEEFSAASLVSGEDFDTMKDGTHYRPDMGEEEAERNNDTIIRNMRKLSGVLEEAVSGAADKLGTIEYVMDKFTFLTSKTDRDHYFRKGEVEYIISGSDTKKAAGNIKNTEYYIVANVLLQVWALRFALDTIDNFVRSPIIFPPQRLTFAIAEGALDSTMDMYNLLKGEAVPVCPKSLASVKLKYSDHLKLLLLMKPEEEILRKARQLMQVNIKQTVDAGTGLARSDFRLEDYNTVISASVTARVNLFFLPMIHLDRLLPDCFEGGRYIIHKKIYIGY